MGLLAEFFNEQDKYEDTNYFNKERKDIFLLLHQERWISREMRTE